MKTTWRSVCFLCLLLGIVVAQRPDPKPATRYFPAELHPVLPSGISVGQAVFDARSALKAHNIVASDLAKPFPQVKAELSALAFTIDLDNVGAYAFYNKTTQKITGLTIVFKPFGDADKSTEAHVEAKALRWNADRTYEIHFEPPADPAFTKSAAAIAPGKVQPPALLYPGQALAEAERTMKDLKIDFGSGRRAIQKPPPDQEEYSFNIDSTQTRGLLFYSKTTSKVLGLIADFRPSNPQLSDETDLSVAAWTFHPDGSYSIRFKAPPTRVEYEEAVRKRANTPRLMPTPNEAK
jgi:hypothetical protein